MAKIKTKESKASTSIPTANPENLKQQHRKNNKKKILWKNKVKQVGKKKQKDTKVLGVLPPKVPQEFSSNWKTLQELLKQKAASLDKSLPVSQTYSKKHTTKKGNVKGIPALNGGGNMGKFKSVNKMDSDPAKVCVPLATPKSERTAPNKNLSDGKGNRKKHKKRKNGNIEKEQGDIKHKRRKAEEHTEQPLAEADIWFDGVDPEDIEAAIGPEAAKVARRNMGIEEGKSQLSMEQVLVKEKAFAGLTKAVAMDCEMVGVGPQGEDSILARVSIVNQFGKCIYDKYVKPTEKVTDYRTAVSGIRPKDIKKGAEFKNVQKEVADILRGRILVGHAVHNDLKILFLDHPKKKIRDTQRYKPFRKEVKSGRPSLKLLCEKLLNVKVQTSEHCSIQDAQAAMRLYTLVKKQWEAAIKAKPKL
ncbi:RNA exonuclease 4 [Chelonia mydas]|uniref:RNA exonuclease 4 n=1 Tax=Chelonia mydas TaxID=8469 RepID=UPI0018A1C931|nr:RNA exonuclease 4 [Chelonia mydas]XP_037735679.1 RNA exonuclease 4 [Chelonia mydas]XP_043386263.1 RNA exonuclease 4 [Chelonia mydas]